jgi:hypothetical protein
VLRTKAAKDTERNCKTAGELGSFRSKLGLTLGKVDDATKFGSQEPSLV